MNIEMAVNYSELQPAFTIIKLEQIQQKVKGNFEKCFLHRTHDVRVTFLLPLSATTLGILSRSCCDFLVSLVDRSSRGFDDLSSGTTTEVGCGALEHGFRFRSWTSAKVKESEKH